MTSVPATVARRALATVCAIIVSLGLAAPAMADDDGEGPWIRVSRPLNGWTIAVDPGHNGGNAASSLSSQLVSDGRGNLKPCNSAGTTSVDGYPEHRFNFEVAQQLRDRLEAYGATVVLTREDDGAVGPCVDIRGRFPEDVDADLMISIHANGSTDSSASGFFAIVSDPAISPSQGEPSLELAASLIDSLTAQGIAPSNTVPEALMYREDLATLNFARRPAVLLELGEMRNPEDAVFMQSVEGQRQYVIAITSGVVEWASEREPIGAS
ncbi:MAG: N-acetylmuramoyl-L-alanine amidase [Beutenbergiaceae bacterium]